MKLSVLQENLSKSLSFVGKNVSTKTQLPVLSNILLETDKGRIKVSSTNLETSISFWVGASIEEEGSITVPARLFQELISSFPPGKIEIESEKTKLKIASTGSKATITGIDAAEFPPLPSTVEKKGTYLNKKELEKGLPFILIAVSNDESRPLLTGIKFLVKDNKLMMVATDGYRLSIKTLAKTPGLEEEFIVSGRALSDVFRLASEEKTENINLTFSKDKNQTVFTLENALVATRLIEGEYPVFERIIPSSYTTRAVFDKGELMQAVKFAAVYAKEAANILKITITPDKTTVSANSPQIGENKTELNAKTEGEGGEIAFNARFLQDLLSVFPEDEVVFEMTGPLAPGVFKPAKDDSFLHIIMPVRVQG